MRPGWLTKWALGKGRGHQPRGGIFETPPDKTLKFDWTLEDSYTKPTNQGKFNIFFDQHRGNVVNALEDDSVDDAATETGEAAVVLESGIEQGPLCLRRARMHDGEMSC